MRSTARNDNEKANVGHPTGWAHEGLRGGAGRRWAGSQIQPGECFGLLGPNGAGKTTTVEILEGVQSPTSGEVEVLGLRWKSHGAELRRPIGVALQETRLPDKLTVQEVLELFRSFYADGRTVEDLLEVFQLGEKRGAWVSKLSGGQRQRLAVACAMVGDPNLLFLDEPTTGLDPQSRRALWDVIAGLVARGKTVLLTTHYMDEAERLCGRVGVVDHGRLIGLGTPAELIAGLGAAHLIELSTRPPVTAGDFAGMETVRSARPVLDGLVLSVDEPHRALPAVLTRVSSLGAELTRLTTRHATLEDVFVSLTGRSLRDA